MIYHIDADMYVDSISISVPSREWDSSSYLTRKAWLSCRETLQTITSLAAGGQVWMNEYIDYPLIIPFLWVIFHFNISVLLNSDYFFTHKLLLCVHLASSFSSFSSHIQTHLLYTFGLWLHTHRPPLLFLFLSVSVCFVDFFIRGMFYKVVHKTCFEFFSPAIPFSEQQVSHM